MPRSNEDLTPRELVQCLVLLRFAARTAITNSRRINEMLTEYRNRQENLSPGLPEWTDAAHMVAALQEDALNLKFREIEIGQQLVVLCSLLDKKVEREAVFDALNTNKADRDTDLVRKYGNKTSHLIAVLDLENSATKSDDIEIRPLKWCKTMAMLHAMQTNPALDQVIHDGANEFFGGVFGEYQERSLTDRLAGMSV